MKKADDTAFRTKCEKVRDFVMEYSKRPNPLLSGTPEGVLGVWLQNTLYNLKRGSLTESRCKIVNEILGAENKNWVDTLLLRSRVLVSEPAMSQNPSQLPSREDETTFTEPAEHKSKNTNGSDSVKRSAVSFGLETKRGLASDRYDPLTYRLLGRCRTPLKCEREFDGIDLTVLEAVGIVSVECLRTMTLGRVAAVLDFSEHTETVTEEFNKAIAAYLLYEKRNQPSKITAAIFSSE